MAVVRYSKVRVHAQPQTCEWKLGVHHSQLHGGLFCLLRITACTGSFYLKMNPLHHERWPFYANASSCTLLSIADLGNDYTKSKQKNWLQGWAAARRGCWVSRQLQHPAGGIERVVQRRVCDRCPPAAWVNVRLQGFCIFTPTAASWLNQHTGRGTGHDPLILLARWMLNF